jgi:hypothetical protein
MLRRRMKVVVMKVRCAVPWSYKIACQNSDAKTEDFWKEPYQFPIPWRMPFIRVVILLYQPQISFQSRCMLYVCPCYIEEYDDNARGDELEDAKCVEEDGGVLWVSLSEEAHAALCRNGKTKYRACTLETMKKRKQVSDRFAQAR